MNEYYTLTGAIIDEIKELHDADAQHDPSFHGPGLECGGCRLITLAKRLNELMTARDDTKPIRREGKNISSRDRVFARLSTRHQEERALKAKKA
jgi:hypothetical protein